MRVINTRVSIRSFPTLLQAVADHYLITQEGSVSRAAWPAERIAEADTPGRTKLFAVTAFVRAALRREITRMACRGQGWISALKWSADLDDLLAALGRSGSVLDPEIGAALIRRAQEYPQNESRVILASNFARPLLAELLFGSTESSEHSWIVIAPEEIEAGVPLKIAGIFNLGPSRAKEEESNNYPSSHAPNPDGELRV